MVDDGYASILISELQIIYNYEYRRNCSEQWLF